MTGKIMMLGDQAAKQGAINRDLQIAQDFAKMAEFGYLDKEFTMYGSAYLGLDHKMNYIISNKRNEIYRFIEKSAYNNLCPTGAISFTEICPVPSGYEEDIAQQVKLRLAKKLQHDYKKPMFESLKQFAQKDGNDAAYDLLLKEQEKMEGLFDRDALVVFEGLVDLAFQKKLLSQRSLHEFQKWMKKIKQQMEDDLVIGDIMEKTLYGYAYQTENGLLKYTINAQYDSIYAFALKTQDQGYQISPIFYKKYYYNYKYTLMDVKNDFHLTLKKLLNSEYMNKIKSINEMSSSIKAQEFRNLLESYKEKNDNNAIEMLRYYENKWCSALKE